MSEVALNKNLKRFADEYLVDLNGTRAYQATHPASKSEAAAAVGASRLLRNPKVSAYIAEKMMQREQRTEITQDKVLRELAGVGFSKASDGPESDLKYSSKLRALELMGKHLGMFGDRLAITSEMPDAFRQLTADELRTYIVLRTKEEAGR